MYYLLTCECGIATTVSRTQAGQAMRCSCGRTLNVPNLRELATLPTAQAPESTPLAGSRTEQAQSVWLGWRGTAVALATALFVIAGLVTARYIYLRMAVDPSYTAENEIANGDEMFAKASPEELSFIWNDYQKVRLATKDPPMFHRIAKFAGEQERSAWLGGSVAAVGGLAALAIWLTAPRSTKPKRPKQNIGAG